MIPESLILKIKALKNISTKTIISSLQNEEISLLTEFYKSDIEPILYFIRNNNNEYIRLHCDCGNKIKLTSLRHTVRRNKIPYCCISCANKSVEAREKAKKTCLEKYGTSHPMKAEEVKSNFKQQMLDKYGVEFALQLDSIKEKVVKSNLEKYGVKNPMQLDEFKQKSKLICMEKYGQEYYMATDEFKQKSKQTSIQKYGTSHPMQSGAIKEKYKKQMIDNYGYDHNFKVPEIQNKIKVTCIKKYGFDNPAKAPGIIHKIQDTKNEKYSKEDLRNFGRKRYTHIDYDFLKRIEHLDHVVIQDRLALFEKQKYSTMNSFRNFLKKNDTTYDLAVSKSFMEMEVYNFVKNNYDYKIISGFRLDGKELDIYIPEKKLAIEFNGDYWHSIENKESNYHLNKTNLCETKGIRLIHIWEHEWIYDRKYIEYILNCYLNNKIPNYKCYSLLSRDYFSTLDFPNNKIIYPELTKSGNFDVYKTGYIQL